MLLNRSTRFSLENFKRHTYFNYVQFSTDDKNSKSKKIEGSRNILEALINVPLNEKNSLSKTTKAPKQNINSEFKQTREISIGDLKVVRTIKPPEMDVTKKPKKIIIEHLLIESDQKSPEIDMSKKLWKLNLNDVLNSYKESNVLKNVRASKKEKLEEKQSPTVKKKLNLNDVLNSYKESNVFKNVKASKKEKSGEKQSPTVEKKLNLNDVLNSYKESNVLKNVRASKKEKLEEKQSPTVEKKLNLKDVLNSYRESNVFKNVKASKKEKLEEKQSPTVEKKFSFENLLIWNQENQPRKIPIITINQSSVERKKPNIADLLTETYQPTSNDKYRNHEKFSEGSKIQDSNIEEFSESSKIKEISVSEYLNSILQINSIFGNVPEYQRKEKSDKDKLFEILKTLNLNHIIKEEISDIPNESSFISNYDPSNRLNIFSKHVTQEKNSEESSNIIDAIESQEYRKLNRHLSFNSFHEAVYLTKDKKMWNFPIDNDQDSEELKVGFHEHVFPQQYLTGKLPKTGMIGQFMNYVCVGLSQNPHLTVEEKKSHIKWYEEYLSKKIEQIDMAMQKSIDDAKYEQELRNKR